METKVLVVYEVDTNYIVVTIPFDGEINGDAIVNNNYRYVVRNDSEEFIIIDSDTKLRYNDNVVEDNEEVVH